MGAAFDKWLGRPSSLWFLRRLVAASENHPHSAALALRRLSHRAPISACTEEDTRTDKPNHVEHLRSRTDDCPDRLQRLSQEPEFSIPQEAWLHSLDKNKRPEEAFKSLWLLNNVGPEHRLGTLAIDRPEYRTDLKLWTELLQYRQRIDGFSGIAEVWKGMRYRQVDLPVEGPEADILWPTLIYASFAHEDTPAIEALRKSVYSHAKELFTRKGCQYHGLYKCILSRVFHTKPKEARPWHKDFVAFFGTSHVDLKDLASAFAAADYLGGRASFTGIYLASHQRDLYDAYIPEIMKRWEDRNVLKWHRFFLKHGDGPGTEIFATPEVQRLFELDQDKSLPMVHTKRRKETSPSTILAVEPPHFPPLTRAYMSSLLGEVHGIKPKEVSDSFVAKMFATQAFSVDFIFQGLSFFAMRSLGPIALREMAIRTGSLDVFREKLQKLQAMGIEVAQSVYGRMLTKIATDGSAKLFDFLLANDQHPEDYDNMSIQEQILTASFGRRRNYSHIHVTLMALSLGGHTSNDLAWNTVLQSYILKLDYKSVSKVMEQMQTLKVLLTPRSLRFLLLKVLPRRDRGRGPSTTPEELIDLNPLQFTTNAFMYAAKTGTKVLPFFWRELLKRYGMMGKFTELIYLVRWLIGFYHSRTDYGQKYENYYTVTLTRIFSTRMLDAIVAWGFRDAAARRLLRELPSNFSDTSEGRDLTCGGRCEPWARGLLLLKDIDGLVGVPIRPKLARYALLGRLWFLFGPAFSTKPINRHATEINELSLAHYIRHGNEIWEGKLLAIPNETLDSATNADLLVSVFGTRHIVSLKRQEYTDVNAYAHALETGQHRPFPQNHNARRRAEMWHHSPFRHGVPRDLKISYWGFRSLLRRQGHQSPSAHSSSSPPQPNPEDTRERSSTYSPPPESAPQASDT